MGCVLSLGKKLVWENSEIFLGEEEEEEGQKVADSPLKDQGLGEKVRITTVLVQGL